MIYALVILLWTVKGPEIIDRPFGSQFDCQVAEGSVLSVALKDPDVNGWTVLDECKAVPEAKKT